MKSRYRATLNGIELESISPSILLTDISYGPPKRQNSAIRAARRDGARIHNRYKEKAECTITFAIREYDIASRQEVCQAICSWAKSGGELRTNDRPGQRLICVCDELPAIQSALRWTDPLTILFTAYALPYWQDASESALEISGTGSGEMFVPGSAEETFVSARITANSAVTGFTLKAGDTQIVLSGISIPEGGVVTIDYDDQMIQRIRYGNTSLLNKRTGDDDLTVPCGARSTFEVTGNVNVRFYARGLWE